MNKLFFLLGLLATNALAAPPERDPVPIIRSMDQALEGLDEIFRQGDEQKLQKQFEILADFPGKNEGYTMDRNLIPLLAEYGLEEADALHAIENARNIARKSGYKLDYSPLLKEEVERTPSFQDIPDIPLSKVFSQPQFSEEIYIDDRNMDILLALMLSDGKSLSSTKFGILGQKSKPEDLDWIMEQVKEEISTEMRYGYWDREERVKYQEKMQKEIPEEIAEASKFWEILRQARLKIKEFDGYPENPSENPDVDNQMIKALVPLLKRTHSEKDIQKIMEQARHANTLKLASENNLQRALATLVKIKIDCPVYIFSNLLHATINRSVTNILGDHPSFIGWIPSQNTPSLYGWVARRTINRRSIYKRTRTRWF